MKKAIFLMLPVMALLLTGCAGPTCNGFKATGQNHALTNSNTPESLNSSAGRGLYLPISSRSAININLDCIFELAQFDSTLGSEKEKHDLLNPWIRFDFSY